MEDWGEFRNPIRRWQRGPDCSARADVTEGGLENLGEAGRGTRQAEGGLCGDAGIWWGLGVTREQDDLKKGL